MNTLIQKDRFWDFLTVWINQQNTNIILWIVIIGAVLFAIYKYLRFKGILRTSEENSISSVSKDIYKTREVLLKNILNIHSLLEQTLECVQSHLRNEQVDIVIKMYFEFLRTELLAEVAFIVDSYKNHTMQSDELMIQTLRNKFKRVITTSDEKVFYLPNTRGSMLQTENKLESFEKANFFNNVMMEIKSGKEPRQTILTCRDMLDTIIFDWYIR